MRDSQICAFCCKIKEYRTRGRLRARWIWTKNYNEHDARRTEGMNSRRKKAYRFIC